MTTQSWVRQLPANLASSLWHWLRRPWLAILAGIVGVILSVAVLRLPQLPGQLVDEQAAAATWLLNASTAYGMWGNLFLALGLFDVLRSPLLYLLLALLMPTLAAQLADQLGALRQLRNVQAADLNQPAQSPGIPIAIAPLRPIFRWRGLINATQAEVLKTLITTNDPAFAKTKQGQAVIDEFIQADTEQKSPSASPNETVDSESSTEKIAITEKNEAIETRLLAQQAPRLQLLRPLLMIGLLIAVVGAWLALAYGWQVTAPPLAPGETFRSANRNLVLRYLVNTTGKVSAELEALVQSDQLTIAATQSSQQRIGPITIQTRPTYPGVWIATADQSEILTLPGESKLRSGMGFVFSTPGSEESILVPEQAAGLRIVQRAGTENFVLELYRSDGIQPIYRAELTQGGQLTIPFTQGSTELIITTLPGLQVDVRYLPGLWLVPLGIILSLIGVLAFIRPSYFVLIQVAPWAINLGATTSPTRDTAPTHTVVILQSDHPSLITKLQARINELPPPTSGTATHAEGNSSEGNNPDQSSLQSSPTPSGI